MELLEALYEYVQDEYGKYCLHNSDYRKNCFYRDKHLDWLRANLSGEALEHLEAGLDMKDTAQSEELRAMYRASLIAGVRLGALGRLAE